MEIQRPVNQKAVYHSAGELFVKIMSLEIDKETAKNALKALSIMNTTYIAELKRWELDQSSQSCMKKSILRNIEIKGFDNIPINKTSEQ